MKIQSKIIFVTLLSIVSLFSCREEGTIDQLDEFPDPVAQSKSLKRGVSFAYQFVEDIEILGTGVSWSYNWGPGQSSTFDQAMKEQQIDFCPMAWNGVNETAIREYVSRNPNTEYLLAFNEPNLVDQARMTPQEAAAKWGEVKSIADELGLKIISPAMNYGTLEGYHDPIVWLDEFFSLVPESDIDGISIHCYMPNASALKSYVERFKKYGKPIWLTEFCAWEGHVTPESQQRFLADAINYLESDPDIFRYAWFIPRGSGSEDAFPYMFLLKNAVDVELTSLGKVYTQMSTQDKSIYYQQGQQIEAEHYTSISVSDGVGEAGWVDGPKVRVTSEAPNNTLELYNFLPDQWVEYQIEPLQTKTYDLEIRYASFVDAELKIEVDGEETIYNLANTTEDFIWNTATIPLPLKKGKHTLRITLNEGTVCMNWLSFN
ncbi:glycosyl hydrolase [Sediminitomix flava]|uniref:Carbohydrate binding protein with CBM6 domain n=1 Tax=Sediminitomix flava TaxID=379075 RepID=A0A315ZZV0_SEDFL|nr:glycosyl hydrolase [Sediminitomix flava]PWJ42907.1 carbohydrate binding protein with CBM6 domain [Sediminitomix flava]